MIHDAQIQWIESCAIAAGWSRAASGRYSGGMAEHFHIVVVAAIFAVEIAPKSGGAGTLGPLLSLTFFFFVPIQCLFLSLSYPSHVHSSFPIAKNSSHLAMCYPSIAFSGLAAMLCYTGLITMDRIRKRKTTP